MAKQTYRVRLVAVEQSSSAKSRAKNLGDITCMETTSKREAERERNRLQAMIDHESWLVAARVICEVAETMDFQEIINFDDGGESPEQMKAVQNAEAQTEARLMPENDE